MHEGSLWIWVVRCPMGLLLWTNPEARQTTGDLLRSAGNAIAPKSSDQKTLQEQIKKVLESK